MAIRLRLTSKEQEIFDIICQNPQISQDELASKLGITRSSVSVHISSLIKKKYIEGKGYIINNKNKVVIIGASMVDIVGISNDTLIENDSNPGRIRLNAGGAARNVAENLAHLDTHVTLITAICNDSLGQVIKNSCLLSQIDITDALYVDGGITTTYMAVLSKDGELALGVSDTEAIDNISIEFIQKKQHVINSGEIVMLDATLSEDVIAYLLENFPSTNMYVETVSLAKAQKIKPYLSSINMLKCSRTELGYLVDIKIVDEQDIVKGVNTLHKLGIEKVIVTICNSKIYYSDHSYSGFKTFDGVKVVNETGAKDSFMAGYLYGELNGYEIERSIEIASKMLVMTLSDQDTVSKKINANKIKERA